MTRSVQLIRPVCQPISQHSHPAFTARGTCKACGLQDVCMTTDSVCALCVMTGRA